MADSGRSASKRSRFDQTEPEPKRASRFDRRSRSPSSKKADPRRSRSPVSGAKDSSPPAVAQKASGGEAAAAAAAAAAARINAALQAKRGIQHIDVPPIRSTASPVAKAGSPTSANGSGGGSKLNEMYIDDGDFIQDIEVNDLRNRYTLTKGSTQKMIKDETGADITTRGNYYPDKTLATAANPPLYLHITSVSKAGLEAAVAKINELMQQELPNLVDERRFRRREPEQVERDEYGRRKWPEERIPIELEPLPGFNLRAQVVGHGGSYVKHIQQETRCRVQIKGRGSGFIENGLSTESDEPMYLHVAGPDPAQVASAKELCQSLLKNVREQYERFKENPPQRSYGGGYGGYGGGGGGGYGQQQNQQNANNYANPYGSYGTSSAQSPSTPSAAPGTSGPPGVSSPGGTASSTSDMSAAYAQYYAQNPGQDPYAAYGGYQNYVAYYQYYMAAQQQQQAGGAAGANGTSAPGASGTPAPPATDNEAPPPPPPPPSGSPPAPPGGSYSAVPPPPGM